MEAEDAWTNNKRLNERNLVKLFVKVLTPTKANPKYSLGSTTGGSRYFERQETFQAKHTIHDGPVKKRNVATLVNHRHQKASYITERNSTRLRTHNGVDVIQRQNEAGDDIVRSGFVLMRPFRASGRRFSNCTGPKCQGLGFGNNIRRLTLDARLRYMGIGKRLAS